MIDLDAVISELRRFPDRPPSPAPDVSAVRARARSRRRRRQARLGVLGVMVAVGGVTAWTQRNNERLDVRAVDDGVSSPDPVAPDETGDLRVEPATGLVDGQEVLVTMAAAPAADVLVVQCAVEAARVSDPAPWCDLNTRVAAVSGGGGRFAVTVARTIETTNGLIDCAEAPQRCVIGVRSGGIDSIAVIAFRTDLGPAAAPVLRVEPASVTAGDAVTVSGSGYSFGAEVVVSQCRVFVVDGGGIGCDSIRAIRVVADKAGQFSRRMLVQDEIFEAGWVDCQPCVLQAHAVRHPPAQAPIEISSGSGSRRPTVTINPPGPFRRNQTVQLSGTGFQADDRSVEIGWCRFNTDDPFTEAQGAGPDFATCAYPAVGVATDSAGTFVIDAFPMPSETFGFGGATCEEPEARCGLAWHVSEGSAPAFITFFQMQAP